MNVDVEMVIATWVTNVIHLEGQSKVAEGEIVQSIHEGKASWEEYELEKHHQ